jgi:iron complex outermembrane receptor protein
MSVQSTKSNQDINVYAASPRVIAPVASGPHPVRPRPSIADKRNHHVLRGGIKTVLFDHRLRFNLTGYFFKTKDLQLSAVGGATNANLLLNADAVKGAASKPSWRRVR